MNTSLGLISCATLLLAASPALAANGESYALDWINSSTGCYSLLTEAECAKHMPTLARLSNTSKRIAYLETHGVDIRDRASMCGCTRNAPESVHYPLRGQKLVRN